MAKDPEKKSGQRGIPDPQGGADQRSGEVKPPSGKGAGRNGVRLPAAVIFALAVLLCSPVLWGGFLEFDDQYFILTDGAVRSISFENLKTILTEPYFANFHPLTRLSYAVDHALFGLRPFGYHLTSLLLYGVCCALAFLFLAKLLDDRRVAALGALLFAAHTTHLEVVAWISARKDLLCLAFGLGALLLFFRQRERDRFSLPLYLGMLACCFLAGYAKSLAVILPLLLLSMDRLWFQRWKWRYLLELVPVIAIMVWVGHKNMEAQTAAGAVKSASLPLRDTCGVFLAYLWKTVLPLSLSPRYVLDPEGAPAATALLGGLLFIGLVCIAVVRFIQRDHLFPTCFAFFLIPLLPVSQIVPLSTPMADRYLFWPTLAWSLLLGGWMLQWRRAFSVCAVLLVIYTGLTMARCGVWKDDQSLWEDALKENPDNPFALAALGNRALDGGEPEEARALLLRAMEQAKGTLSTPYLDYGRLLRLEGRLEEALGSFRTAYAIETDAGWLAHRAAGNMGIVLNELARRDEAIPWFEKALVLVEKTGESKAELRLGLAKVYYDEGRFIEAEAQYGSACSERPADPRPRFYLGLARLSQGRAKEAVQDFEAALALGDLPADASFRYGDVHLMLGKVYQEHLNRADLALAHYNKLLELDPGHPQAGQVRAMIRYLTRE